MEYSRGSRSVVDLKKSLTKQNAAATTIQGSANRAAFVADIHQASLGFFALDCCTHRPPPVHRKGGAAPPSEIAYLHIFHAIRASKGGALAKGLFWLNGMLIHY